MGFLKPHSIIYGFLKITYLINVICTTFPSVGFVSLKLEIVYFPVHLTMNTVTSLIAKH